MIEDRVMLRYNRFTGLLILFLFFTMSVGATHFYEDTADHHVCPICVAINHQSAAGPSTITFDGNLSLLEATFVVSVPALPIRSFSFLSARAAPQLNFSHNAIPTQTL